MIITSYEAKCPLLVLIGDHDRDRGIGKERGEPDLKFRRPIPAGAYPCRLVEQDRGEWQGA